VRIADICASRLCERADDQIDPIGIGGSGERDFRPLGARQSHIDGDVPVGEDCGFEQPSQGLDPNLPVPRLPEQQVGDAAGGIPACLGLATIGIANPHHNTSLRMTRRLEQDQLVAADAGTPIGERRHILCPQRDGVASTIENDEIVPEPVHLEKRDPAHRAAYMAAGPALSNTEAATPDRGAGLSRYVAPGGGAGKTSPALACRAPAFPCFAVVVFEAATGARFVALVDAAAALPPRLERADWIALPVLRGFPEL